MANRFLTPLCFDPASVVLSLGGYSPYGYMSDTKIEIAKAEDNILPLVGVDGDLSLALNRNLSGTLTLTLQATSPSNDVLAAMAAQVKSTKFATFPVLMSDPAGLSVISTVGWIQKVPDVTISKEVSPAVWVIGLWQAEPTGNTATSALNTIATITSLSF